MQIQKTLLLIYHKMQIVPNEKRLTVYNKTYVILYKMLNLGSQTYFSQNVLFMLCNVNFFFSPQASLMYLS